MKRRNLLKYGATLGAGFSIPGLANAAPVIILGNYNNPQVLASWMVGTQGSQVFSDPRGPLYYGTVSDGPFNPYRRNAGDIVRAMVPHTESKALYLTQGTLQLPSFSPYFSYISARNISLSAMDMSHWLFSVFNVDNNLAYGVAHNENYTHTFYSNGRYWGDTGNPSCKWLNCLSLLRTVDRDTHDAFGYAFTPQPFNGFTQHNDQFMIIHPAPDAYGAEGKINGWGFFHPSNFIEDNGYVYFSAHPSSTPIPKNRHF